MRLPKNLFTGTYAKPKIFLCETDKQKMGVLNTTDTHVSLKFNTYSELTFNIDRTYIDALTGNKQTHLFYDRIEHPRLILLDNIGYFQIQAPDMSSNGFKESKSITAYSSEYALAQKYITNLHVNTGEVDSVEVIYAEEIGTPDLIKPVVFYDEGDHRLSLLHLALEGVYGWKIGHIDDSLKTLVRSFDIDRQSVYDFLMNEVCQKYNCYIVFDTLKNEINIYAEAMSAKFIGDGKTKTFTVSPPFYKIETVSIDGYKTTQWEYNSKTGVLTLQSAPKNSAIIEVVDGGLTEWETDVFITYENLAKEMQVSYNADDIKTRLTVTYGDDLDIREINMGLPYITDLSYYYTVDWMGQELYDAYTAYLKKSQTYQANYSKNSQEMLEISNCQYFEEHRLSIAYSKVDNVDSSTVGTYYVKDSSNGGYFFKEVVLPDDYKAYTTYYQFDGVKLNSEKVNNLYIAIRENFKSGSIEDPDEALKALNESIKKINELADSFEFMNDDDRYGITYLSDNLNNFNALEDKKTCVMNFLQEMWEQVGRTPLQSLYKETFKTLQSTNIDWAQEHIDPDGNKTYDENYPWYYAIILFLESIDIAIADRTVNIYRMQQAYDVLQAENMEISNVLLMENNFTEDQLIRLSAFIKEDELHIEDIIETEYDTLEDSFKVKQDAMEAGRIELSKRCQPQLQFSMTMANIYALPEFEPIISQFQLGKVIKVGIRKETKTLEFIGDGVKKNFVLTPPLYEVKTVYINGIEQTNWAYNNQTGILTPNKYSTPKSGVSIEAVGTNNYIKQSRLLEVDMGLDDLSDFQAQFGELTDLRSQSDIHADLLSQAIQAGKSVASSQDNWNAGADIAVSTDIKIQQGLLDATTVLKSMDGTQGVEMDKYGIKLKKVNPDNGEIDPKQGWITNNMMVYTDNNWESAKSVFGEYKINNETRWGLLADACIAGYIEGSTLVGGKISIGEKGDGSYNFSVDAEGNIVANGTIYATAGSIAGYNIGKGGTYGNALYKRTSETSSSSSPAYEVGMKATDGDTDLAFFVKKSTNSWKSSENTFYINNSGRLYCTDGKIGGWEVGSLGNYNNSLYSTYCAKSTPSTSNPEYATFMRSTGDKNTIAIGVKKRTSSSTDWADSENPFYVRKDGYVFMNNADVTGKITASSGEISGNLTLSGSLIHKSEDEKYQVTLRGVQPTINNGVFYITDKSEGYSQYPFRVNGDGSFTATKATIKGNITAEDGTIGGCKIENGTLQIQEANISGTLSADKISGGTIDAATINVTNLNADNINNGSLSRQYVSGSAYDSHYGSYRFPSGCMTKGINDSCGYADFSNDVFNDRDSADYLSVDVLLQAKSASVEGILATKSRSSGKRGLCVDGYDIYRKSLEVQTADGGTKTIYYLSYMQ